MKFEDLFGKGPSNYVEYPPKPAGTLDQFFKERTPAPRSKRTPEMDAEFYREMNGGREGVAKPKAAAPAPKTTAQVVKPEVQAVHDAAPKVEQSTVDQIKQKYSLTPKAPEAPAPEQEVAPEQPQVQPRRGLSDLDKLAASESSSSSVSQSSPLSDIDTDWVKSNADKLAPHANATDFGLGLIPLAMDAIFGGNKGYAYKDSSKYFMDTAGRVDKRKETLEDKLLAIQQARTVASAKAAAKSSKGGNNRFETVRITDKNDPNQTIIVNKDKSTGKFYSPDGMELNQDKIGAGYSVNNPEWRDRADITQDNRISMEGLRQGNKKDFEVIRQKNRKEATDYTPRLDPNTGELARATPQGMAPITPQTSRLNNKQEKDLTDSVNKFTTTDQYKKPAEVIRIASGIGELLTTANDKNNPVASAAARKELAKMAEGGGKLTDKDVEEFGGSPSIRAKVKRFANLQRNGNPLTKDDMDDLREVARILEAQARKKLEGSINDLDNANVSIHGGVKGSVKEKMKAYMTPQGFPRTVRKGNHTATVSNAQELKEANAEGFN